MGNARFRRVGSGGIKFRRNFSIEWSCLFLISEKDAVGEDGNLIIANCFGLNSQQEISSLEATFKSPSQEVVFSSAGREHKVVSGPFFKSQSGYSGSLDIITTYGAWCPTLPTGQHLYVSQHVEIDGVYEARLIFSSGKKNGSSSLIINDEINVDMTDGSSRVVVGRFIATKSDVSFSIKSTDAKPPLINAFILRKIGTAPRIDASILLT